MLCLLLLCIYPMMVLRFVAMVWGPVLWWTAGFALISVVVMYKSESFNILCPPLRYSLSSVSCSSSIADVCHMSNNCSNLMFNTIMGAIWEQRLCVVCVVCRVCVVCVYAHAHLSDPKVFINNGQLFIVQWSEPASAAQTTDGWVSHLWKTGFLQPTAQWRIRLSSVQGSVWFNWQWQTRTDWCGSQIYSRFSLYIEYVCESTVLYVCLSPSDSCAMGIFIGGYRPLVVLGCITLSTQINTKTLNKNYKTDLGSNTIWDHS